MKNRTATARWTGGLKDGKGVLSTGSEVIKDVDYNFDQRFGEAAGTNPEELVAAAHAGCFSMALSGQLNAADLAPESIETNAKLTFEKKDEGWTVTAIHLDVTATVPGAEQEAFLTAAENAKKGCPISRLLNAEITMEARLA